MSGNLRKLLSRLPALAKILVNLDDRLTRQDDLSASMLIKLRRKEGLLDRIDEAEFQVTSQFGEDGIIQYLIDCAKIQPNERSFVECGTENYTEANTRFLLVHNNWRGLIIDGSEANMAVARSRSYYWRHDLTAVASFITTENIAQLIAPFATNLGLLSIDIDGNDYWIWEKLSVDPVIVVAEYNSVFGAERPVSVPYDPAFQRTKAHYSNLYYGCSLKALEYLATRKGYALVGSNTAGNNAFFVRRDRLNGLRPLTAQEAYVESRFRESRDERGNLTFLSGLDRAKLIASLPLVNVETGTRTTIADAVL